MEGSTKFLQTEKVGVESSATDFVTSRFAHHSMSKSGDKRSYRKNRSTQCCATCQIFFSAQVVEIDFVCLKSDVARCIVLHSYANILKQADEIIDINNVGYVCQAYLFVGKQSGADHLQSFIFGTLWCYFSTEAVVAFDDE